MELRIMPLFRNLMFGKGENRVSYGLKPDEVRKIGSASFAY